MKPKASIEDEFDREYKKLNTAQKEAVDSIDGPVMVVAGPGTGKTQILALRIGNILKKTDTPPHGILCLTFTNSAVDAMRERLARYIGEASKEVNIFTFHGFGMKVVEEYYEALGMPAAPKLLDETEGAIFFDEILAGHEWEYLRPRADNTRYFKDLKSVISLLARERISPEDFESAIDKEIKFLKEDESSLVSRGANKGELKKETEKEIESLEKSKEIAKFLKLYEHAKGEKNMLDYDDVLENLVKIMETSKKALSDIRERYLYVLVDEHQDSSRVQNEFLSRVWSKLEKPEIFVVGDDRQLIYGFSGASIEHFAGFKKKFPGARIIPLVQNYRSTQVILDAAHALLKSVMSDEKLVSQEDPDSKEKHPIQLIEAENPEEEIMAAAMDLRKKMTEGVKPGSCAILVPKNRQVRNALEILHSQNIPLALFEALNLFDQKETKAFLRILKIIDSGDLPSFALSFFDEFSGVAPLEAHKFLYGQTMRDFSFQTFLEKPASLFAGSPSEIWISKLVDLKKYSEENDLKSLIQKISEELGGSDQGESLVSGQEIADTFLSLLEKRAEATLHEFLYYLLRLQSYGENIQIISAKKEGVRVLTMHSSKGLEFDYVWIAHMDEKSLSGGKKLGFALPESIREKIEERDIDAVKRKLYVAITRAKCFCTLSYSLETGSGREQDVARIVAELPEEVFEKHSTKIKKGKVADAADLSGLRALVAKEYTARNISASLLNNFFECPWKWYFNNLLKLPEDRAEILEFGIAVHESLDAILKMKETPGLEELQKIVSNAVLQTQLSSGPAGERMKREVLVIVSAWVKDRLPEVKLGRKSEESVSLKDKNFPHLKIYGKIDLIENLSKGEIRVTDFKTGSGRRKSEIEKLDEEGRMSNLLRQLVMYSYLLSQSLAWHNVDVRESRLEFLEAKNKKDGIYNAVLQKEHIDLLLRDITDYDRLIKTGEWVNRPCNYNSYGKNTECEYCKIAGVYK